MAYVNCCQHLEIFSEIGLMHGKLSFPGITHLSEKISR